MNRSAFIIVVLCCVFSFALVLPSINNNIKDPNAIVYFSNDEGYLMDLCWKYYSGEKRASYQEDFDYGLELIYLTDAAKIIARPPAGFTPGAFVLFLRWFHLLAWVSALAALYCFVLRHFKSGWIAGVATALLAVRPAFAYLSNNLKPEPLILLLVIVGLDYSLRMLDDPSRKNLVIACALAALAFVIKYAGVFLLPAITAALYFSRARNQKVPTGGKISWLTPLALGTGAIAIAFWFEMAYVRKTTGCTWYDEYGFIGGIWQSKGLLLLIALGLGMVCFSAVLRIFSVKGSRHIKEIFGFITSVNTRAVVVVSIFAGFVLFFGFRWLTAPQSFVSTYILLGTSASSTKPLEMIHEKGLANSFLSNMKDQALAFDLVILLLFLFYVFKESFQYRKSIQADEKGLHKRMVLLVFLIPGFLIMFSMLRMALHHMLPFFAIAAVLALKGGEMFLSGGLKSRFRTGVFALAAVAVLADIAGNAAYSARSRLYQFRQNQDVAFEAGDWLKKSIPWDAAIVADDHTRVYIPGEFANVRNFIGYLPDRAEQLRRLVSEHHPEFIYYNSGASGATAMPPISEMLPGTTLELVKEFDNSGKEYQRRPGDRFVIYRVLR